MTNTQSKLKKCAHLNLSAWFCTPLRNAPSYLFAYTLGKKTNLTTIQMAFRQCHG